MARLAGLWHGDPRLKRWATSRAPSSRSPGPRGVGVVGLGEGVAGVEGFGRGLVGEIWVGAVALCPRMAQERPLAIPAFATPTHDEKMS